VSESSYKGAGKPPKTEVRKDNLADGDDLFDALFEWMPDTIPLTDAVAPNGTSLEQDIGARSEERTSPRKRTADTGRSKRSSVVARSFTDEFIDSSAGGPHSDEELFYRYQDGDDKAFHALYQRYKTSVYSYCSKVLLSVGLPEEIVEDTYQEVFLRVSQYRNTFKQGEFRAWIFTITRNTCLSWKKRGLRTAVASNGAYDPDKLSEEQALASPSHISRSEDPLEALTLKEQTDLLLKAIAELPETYREALMLCEYEGLTYEEIGRLTGTSLSTIRIRVFRAKKRLRKVLTPILGADTIAQFSKKVQQEEDEDE
jgi:RNA polymerase sigma-70 factor (ECF subfamily)